MVYKFQVEVYVHDMLIDLQKFLTEARAQKFAADQQDAGFKVRFKRSAV